jgi:hypothetical protein
VTLPDAGSPSYVSTGAAEAQRLRAASAAPAAERPRPTPVATPRRTVVFEDDLDVPDFLK